MINTKNISNTHIQRIIENDNFNDAIAEVQNLIGQSDGGVASIHFSGMPMDENGDITEWLNKSKRQSIIEQYIQAEESYSLMSLN